MKNIAPESTKETFKHFFNGAFSVDIVLIAYLDGSLKFLLQKKQDYPLVNEWGLPGELILPEQDTEKAIDDLLIKDIGHADVYKSNLRAFSELNRHPLGRIITIAFYGLIRFDKVPAKLPTNLRWVDLDVNYELTLDHNHILEEAKKAFKENLIQKPVVFNLLPKKFIISDLIKIYEIAFEKKVDVANFRKRIVSSKMIRSTGEFKQRYKSHGRPAEYYTYEGLTKTKSEKESILFNF